MKHPPAVAEIGSEVRRTETETTRMRRGDGWWRWRRGREEEGAIELSRGADRGCVGAVGGGWLAPSSLLPQGMWTRRKLAGVPFGKARQPVGHTARRRRPVGSSLDTGRQVQCMHAHSRGKTRKSKDHASRKCGKASGPAENLMV